MNANTFIEQPDGKPEVRAGVRKYLVKGVIAKLVMAAILFLSSGRSGWVMGWALFGVYVTWDVIVALLLIPKSPGLIAERAGIQKGSKVWDIALASLAASLGVDVHDYLSSLPLDRVVQVHVSGPRVRDGRLFDAHEPLQKNDYALLDFVLARTHPQVVTLEYTRERDALRAQLLRLRGILDAHNGKRAI